MQFLSAILELRSPLRVCWYAVSLVELTGCIHTPELVPQLTAPGGIQEGFGHVFGDKMVRWYLGWVG